MLGDKSDHCKWTCGGRKETQTQERQGGRFGVTLVKRSQSLLPGLWLTFFFLFNFFTNLSAPLLSDGFAGEG